ncbi:hypothetical protein VTI74DRAFT_1539 [Chaetomium olivicolor]
MTSGCKLSREIRPSGRRNRDGASVTGQKQGNKTPNETTTEIVHRLSARWPCSEADSWLCTAWPSFSLAYSAPSNFRPAICPMSKADLEARTSGLGAHRGRSFAY